MSSLLDRQLAINVARRVTGSGPSTTPRDRAEVGSSLREACRIADGEVRAFTGWTAARRIPEPEVLTRIDWVEMNLAALAPVFERASEELHIASLVRPFLRVATSVQMGLLFGYLSRKVIGQYDLFGGGGLYFVGPNIVEVERRAKVEPRDLRLWVAIHEVTHALQDGAVPWLRGEITGFIDRSLSVMRSGPSPARVAGAVREAVAQRRPFSSVLDAILTQPQRELLQHAQTLMTVVEGHASFVMDHVGGKLIDDVPSLREKVEGTRGTSLPAERAMQSAIGLDAKRRQYKDGQAFFEALSAARNPETTSRVWETPATMPDADELRHADRWIGRVLGEHPA